MEEMVAQTRMSVNNALKAWKRNSLKEVELVKESEEKVDEMEKEFRDRHIQRVAQGKCAVLAGAVFLDMLSNLERIADHAVNIAEYVEQENA